MAGLNSSGRVKRVVYHKWDIRTEFIRTDGGIRQTPHSPQSGVATQPRRAHPAYRGECHFKYALSSRASHMFGPFAEVRTESRISHSPRSPQSGVATRLLASYKPITEGNNQRLIRKEYPHDVETLA